MSVPPLSESRADVEHFKYTKFILNMIALSKSSKML